MGFWSKLWKCVASVVLTVATCGAAAAVYAVASGASVVAALTTTTAKLAIFFFSTRGGDPTMQAQGQKSADGLAPQRVVLSSRAHLSASHLKTKNQNKRRRR